MYWVKTTGIGSDMDFLSFLKNYKAFDEEEEAEREAFVQFLEAFGDKAYDRDNLVGHFSSSCWIVNKDRTKVLMIYHNMYKTWAWVGGHADGDKDLLHVALKETMEETGLAHVRPVSDEPIDLNMMVVHNHYKRGKFVPRHLHPNVVYLLEADEAEPIRIKEDENSGVQWVALEEVKNYCSNDKVMPYYNRIMQKVAERKL